MHSTDRDLSRDDITISRVLTFLREAVDAAEQVMAIVGNGYPMYRTEQLERLKRIVANTGEELILYEDIRQLPGTQNGRGTPVKRAGSDRGGARRKKR